MLGRSSYPPQNHNPSPCLCGTVIEKPVIRFRGGRLGQCTKETQIESVSCGTCGRLYHPECVCHGSSKPEWTFNEVTFRWTRNEDHQTKSVKPEWTSKLGNHNWKPASNIKELCQKAQFLMDTLDTAKRKAEFEVFMSGRPQKQWFTARLRRLRAATHEAEIAWKGARENINLKKDLTRSLRKYKKAIKKAKRVEWRKFCSDMRGKKANDIMKAMGNPTKTPGRPTMVLGRRPDWGSSQLSLEDMSHTQFSHTQLRITPDKAIITGLSALDDTNNCFFHINEVIINKVVFQVTGFHF
eukprot:sb/3467415/